MTDTPVPSTAANERGRGNALAVYALYLLSIPSAGVFALIGVIVALVSRADAGPLARSHLDDQIRIWWIAFWWAIGLALLWLIGLLLAVLLIGFVIWWLIGILGFLVAAWFTIKSILGLIRLLEGQTR